MSITIVCVRMISMIQPEYPIQVWNDFPWNAVWNVAWLLLAKRIYQIRFDKDFFSVRVHDWFNFRNLDCIGIFQKVLSSFKIRNFLCFYFQLYLFRFSAKMFEEFDIFSLYYLKANCGKKQKKKTLCKFFTFN